ncbi:Ribosomal protein S18 acetylase RimI [Microlunatus soli]|uniref:Ribosomal protein S18 acetylase RimI n=1 Tax=Microlunatus soli TaxID=630515 RepID=A0A1H1S3N8_9ACTN|nr:Ribosomal protein S18 acetylase RimI [Microlunatus soli]
MVPYAVRTAEPEDLVELEWSGGAEHIDALARAVQRSYVDEMAVLVITAGRSGPAGTARTVAVGAVDLTKRPGAGELTMLSVRESWQSLGLGTILIAALEAQVRGHGLTRAVLAVEHDNPRAAALYHRLGYRRIGSELDGWPVGPNRSYATVSFLLERNLGN